jgi:hypothetical protein
MKTLKGPKQFVTSRGVVTFYRLRAERALGKPLPKGACVHHADGSRRDDAPLVICQDYVYHMLLHVRMRVVRAGGNPNTQAICTRCKMPKLLSEFADAPSNSNGRSATCGPCMAISMREYRTLNKARLAEQWKAWYYSSGARDRINARRAVLRDAATAAAGII